MKSFNGSESNAKKYQHLLITGQQAVRVTSLELTKEFSLSFWPSESCSW